MSHRPMAERRERGRAMAERRESRTPGRKNWRREGGWVGRIGENDEGEDQDQEDRLLAGKAAAFNLWRNSSLTADVPFFLVHIDSNSNATIKHLKDWETSQSADDVHKDKRTGSEPGARGSYLKDSEKAEMYKKHKETPEVYTVERLAKDYRIMRQRVHAILWLKELEEEEEKKLGRPLDDSVELLLDTCPEFFNSHDREFHVVSLTYKPDFKVMPEGWDGTTRDLDQVHCEISKKENEMLYQEFVQRMNFNKLKVSSIILTFP
ncbi:hypothetical protein C1H46_024661 [Malus baccata]|uniref:Uncharacterized protein n=1 Tax=Malus baccata TaxID=106549 RepID=A0A540LTY4_MALBA|nr:hypothetical protein C1H46_024661 [Malus baccata]